MMNYNKNNVNKVFTNWNSCIIWQIMDQMSQWILWTESNFKDLFDMD